jgi:hypothetical protein
MRLSEIVSKALAQVRVENNKQAVKPAEQAIKHVELLSKALAEVRAQNNKLASKPVKANTDGKPKYKTDDATKLTSDNDQKTVEPVTGEDVKRLLDENYRKGQTR